MSSPIGRHPRFANRGGFAPVHRASQHTYEAFREVRQAATAALERRAIFDPTPARNPAWAGTKWRV